LNKGQIEKKAAELRKQLGGTIFAFPIHEEEPFSEYAVVVYAGGKYHLYPEAADVSLAALGVKTILEQFKKIGQDSDYKRNVRFISYDAQINAPSVTMRRLKKDNVSKPLLKEGVDVFKRNDEEGYLFNSRGLLKWTYIEMVDEKNPKAVHFMDEYYKLLAIRKYGKTAAAIKQEIRRMNKEQAIDWIERTYKQYIRDDTEVMNIMQTLAGNKG
jgi:hypothetical protein